jgi:tetratricopeptide (TPR) repeat protein
MEAESLFNRLKILFEKESYKEITNIFENLGSKDNLDYRHYRIIAVSYLQIFEYEKALKEFKKCIDLYPKIEERDQLIVEPLYVFAHKLLKNRQYQEFDKASQLLLTFNPDYFFFRNLNRKKIYFQDWDKRGYFDKAITLLNYIIEGEKYLRSDLEREKQHEIWEEICFDKLQRAKEMATEFDLIWEELGIYYLLLLKFEEAEKHLKKAYTMNLSCETIRYNLGLLNQEKGFYEEAIKYFREALEIEPKYKLAKKHITICEAKMIINTAISLQRTGKYLEAFEKYQESLELNPDDAEAKKGLQSVLKIYNKKRIEQLKQLIIQKNYFQAENLLNELLRTEKNNEEIKKLQYELLDLLHQEDIGKQQLAKKIKDRKDSVIFISALEAIRSKHLNEDEIFVYLNKFLPELSVEKQTQILEKLGAINQEVENPIKQFEKYLAMSLDSLNITGSKFIPKVIKTSGQPIDTWLSININSKIRLITERYTIWDKVIPTILYYDAQNKQLIKEAGIIEEESIILVDKLYEGPTAYQIRLLKDGQFAVLSAKKYSENVKDQRKVKEWIFDYKKVDLHDDLIQLHRYEIDYELSIIKKRI